VTDLPADFVPFIRPPLPHQLAAYERFKDADAIALWMEQRTRKTSVALSIFRYRWRRGDVDALLVFADPKGVEETWAGEIRDDFPPDDLAATRVLHWQAGKTAETRFRREEALSLRGHRGPIVALFYAGALVTPKGWKYVNWLLRTRRAMVVADESGWACRWNARTRKLLVLGGFYRRNPPDVATSYDPRHVVVKAILDGTPVAERPDDVYYPTQFLRRGLLGFDSPVAFRERYHEYETERVTEIVDGRAVTVERPRMGKSFRNGRVGDDGEWAPQEFKVLKGYRNLDDLHERMMRVGVRVLRSEVSTAPPPTLGTVEFDLTPHQRHVYDRVLAEYVLELSTGDWPLSEVLKRMTRLQNIARNYALPERVGHECPKCGGAGFRRDGDDDCEACEGTGYVVTLTAMERIDARNPAAEALAAWLVESPDPAIVWARFRQDVSDVIEAATGVGRRLLRYDGTVSAAEREANYRAFRAGEADGMAGIVTSGLSRGKNLTRATRMAFYSNWWGRRARSQAMDRCEALDRTFSTEIVDLCARNTRDGEAVAALRGKEMTAALILGDRK
jgi:hypothetical protein